MDSPPLLAESKPASDCPNKNFFQGFQFSLFHHYKFASKEDCSSQVEEPLSTQPVQIYSAGDPQLEESKTTLKKIEEIDKRLEQGWFFIYELWLYVIIIAGPLKGVILAAFVQHMWSRGDTTLATICSILLAFGLYCIYWSFKQVWLQKVAMSKKDHKTAAKAYSSIVRLAVYFFVLCVVFFLFAMYWGYSTREWSDFKRSLAENLCRLFFHFISVYVIPVGCSVYGSYKVKDLLDKKADLLLESGKSETHSSEPMVPQRILL